jgi:hypothetical protein
MSQRFQTALEAHEVITVVYKQLKECRFNPELMLYYRNIEKMVSNLSSLEVQARQSHKYHKVDAYIAEIEQAIDYLEKMIIISRLTD